MSESSDPFSLSYPGWFWFIRHGYGLNNYYKDTQGQFPSMADPPLHAVGQKQAVESGEQARKMGLDIRHVICSPLQRTLQTAQCFLKAAGYQGEIIVDPLATEMMIPDVVINFGASRQELERQYKKHDGLSFDFSRVVAGQWWPGQETSADVKKRGQDFLTRYFQDLNLPPHQTLVVSHGYWIEHMTDTVSFPNAGIAVIDPVSRQSRLVFMPDPAPWRPGRHSSMIRAPEQKI